MMRILLVRIRNWITEVPQNSLATIGRYYSNVKKLLRGQTSLIFTPRDALAIRRMGPIAVMQQLNEK